MEEKSQLFLQSLLGEAEYFVRFKGSSKNAWLPETQVARRARLLLNSFTRSSPQSPPSMKRDNNTPSQQTRVRRNCTLFFYFCLPLNPFIILQLVADPVALDDVKLLVMRDHLGHHGMQMIGAKLHARHSGARCGLCNSTIVMLLLLLFVLPFNSWQNSCWDKEKPLVR